LWRDRIHAGEYLGELLAKMNIEHPYVLAIPRGGIVVGYPIAKILNCPLKPIISLKIKHPVFEEVAIGYIVERGSPILGYKPTEELAGVPPFDVERSIERAMKESERRIILYRKGEELPVLSSYDVVLVDDGLATGWTVQGAISYLNHENKPRRIILAIPVMPEKSYKNFSLKVAFVACPLIIEDYRFYAVSQGYNSFSQTPDDEVLKLLQMAETFK